MKKGRAAFLLLLFVSVCSLWADNPYDLPLSTVIIDAGHGGHDPGAIADWSFAGTTIYERDIALAIALELERILFERQPDLHVVMTRSDDTYPTLAERSRTAYGTKLPPKTSALFVSIHANSAGTEDASGFEVLTKQQAKRVVLLDEQTPLANLPSLASSTALELNRYLNYRNLVVAKTFEETLATHFPDERDRGIKERNIYVLNASRVPAILVEVGFLSNEGDARNLVSPAWQRKMAEALAEAIGKCR